MFPTGMIFNWAGAIVDIPAGYVLCDGTAGTPDLRNKFIVGAGDTYNPGDSGGAATHVHTFTGDGHNHTIGAGNQLNAGGNFSATTSTDPAAGTTNAGSSLPPYYSLAFIMKT